jgi:alpha-acetolactate decarboxylase
VQKMGKRVLCTGAVLWMCAALSCVQAPERLDSRETAYVYNRVDELLAGDLGDTVRLSSLVRRLRRDSVGIGTTSRAENGEVFILGESVFWIDPEEAGVHKLEDPRETLPFCAVAEVPTSAGSFELSGGELMESVLARCAGTGEGLLALKITGEFGEVEVSVARTIPREGFDFDDPGRCLAFFTEGAASWTMVGFYAAAPEDQRILSVEGHPVHLHGVAGGGSFGGHIQRAEVKKATVSFEPVDRLDISNK